MTGPQMRQARTHTPVQIRGGLAALMPSSHLATTQGGSTITQVRSCTPVQIRGGGGAYPLPLQATAGQTALDAVKAAEFAAAAPGAFALASARAAASSAGARIAPISSSSLLTTRSLDAAGYWVDKVPAVAGAAARRGCSLAAAQPPPSSFPSGFTTPRQQAGGSSSLRVGAAQQRWRTPPPSSPSVWVAAPMVPTTAPTAAAPVVSRRVSRTTPEHTPERPAPSLANFSGWSASMDTVPCLLPPPRHPVAPLMSSRVRRVSDGMVAHSVAAHVGQACSSRSASASAPVEAAEPRPAAAANAFSASASAAAPPPLSGRTTSLLRSARRAASCEVAATNGDGEERSRRLLELTRCCGPPRPSHQELGPLNSPTIAADTPGSVSTIFCDEIRIATLTPSTSATDVAISPLLPWKKEPAAPPAEIPAGFRLIGGTVVFVGEAEDHSAGVPRVARASVSGDSSSRTLSRGGLLSERSSATEFSNLSSYTVLMKGGCERVLAEFCAAQQHGVEPGITVREAALRDAQRLTPSSPSRMAHERARRQKAASESECSEVAAQCSAQAAAQSFAQTVVQVAKAVSRSVSPKCRQGLLQQPALPQRYCSWEAAGFEKSAGLTPVSDDAFKKLASIAQQAHLDLQERLTPRSGLR